MALSDAELLGALDALHRAYPDDPRLARLLVRTMVEQGAHEQAARRALAVARRFVAHGMAAQALGFLEIARRFGANSEEADTLAEMARLAAGSGEAAARRGFELFEALSDEEAADFLRHGRLRRVPDGEAVVRQGEQSTDFFLILDGAFEVRITHGDGHEEAIGVLRAGGFFGEVAAIYRLPRSATVLARGDGELLAFTAEDVQRLAQDFPLAGEHLMRVVARRLLHTMTHVHPAFTELPEDDRRWVADESEVVELDEGEALDPSRRAGALWIVLHGELAAARQGDGAMRLATLAEHDAFGDALEVTALPEDVRIVAGERTLLARVPAKVAQALFAAYAGFDDWMRDGGMRLRRRLGLLVAEVPGDQR